MHRLLQPLVGRDLDFYAMARDTPRGKDCFCRLLLARVWHCYLQGAPGACGQLVGWCLWCISCALVLVVPVRGSGPFRQLFHMAHAVPLQCYLCPPAQYTRLSLRKRPILDWVGLVLVRV